MSISAGRSLGIILVVALTTFATRAFPFIVFPRGREIPDKILYLGKYLTPAVVGMLVIYCLRQTDILSPPHGIPQLLAVALTVVLHVWRKNNLLSIGAGTVIYMVMVQTVF